MEYVWGSFLLLNSARTSGFSGPNPITYQDIQSWMVMTENKLTPQEVDVVKRLDRIYMRVIK